MEQKTGITNKHIGMYLDLMISNASKDTGKASVWSQPSAAETQLSDAVSLGTGAGGQPNAEACGPRERNIFCHRSGRQWVFNGLG